MTQEQIELCAAVSHALRKEKSEIEFTNINHSLICAQTNGLFEIFYPFVENLLNDRIKLRYNISVMEQAFSRENILFELDRICTFAEENNIFILLMKGIYIRNYYPDPSQRTMVDIDLFFDYHQKNKISKMMKSLGYDDVAYSMHHTLWFNSVNNVTVEMHNSLFAEDGLGKSFYSDLLKRAVPFEEYKNVFRMCDNDNYVYALVHLYKHYRYSSASLKQITDLFVMQLYARLSYEEIENEIELLGLNDFYFCIKNIIGFLFKKGEKLSSEEEKIADIICGNRLLDTEGEDSWLANFFKTVFPKPSKIYVFYPFIYKHKWLLPFGYILRIFRCIRTDKVFITKKFSK